jgi:hypothetical protein
MRKFRETINKAKEQDFDTNFGNSQLHLTTLATHPDYMRRGAGEALCDWGIKKAVSDKLAAVTLFSSPMAIRLYTRLGFRQVGIVHTQVDGEEVFIKFPSMSLNLEKIWTAWEKNGKPFDNNEPGELRLYRTIELLADDEM